MASALCAKARVLYHPAPKNAGTSMREYLFLLDNGRPYTPMLVNGRKLELYMIYGQPESFKPAPEVKEFERFTIIRDPVSRFLSAYANRILDSRWHDRRHHQICSRLGLKPIPDLEEFLDHIDQYRQIPAVLHHTRPQHYFLGPTLSYYDKVFRIEELTEAVSYLERRSGAKEAFPSFKSDGPKLSKRDIGAHLEERIAKMFESDYRFLDPFY